MQKLDNDMASVNQLRMNGKLDKLLPKAALPVTGGIAHSDTSPTRPPATAALPQ